MSYAAISVKPKSWTRQISELEIDETLNFPVENERSLSAIISGNNRGGLRKKYPSRKFETKKTSITDPIDLTDLEVLQVKRIA